MKYPKTELSKVTGLKLLIIFIISMIIFISFMNIIYNNVNSMKDNIQNIASFLTLFTIPIIVGVFLEKEEKIPKLFFLLSSTTFIVGYSLFFISGVGIILIILGSWSFGWGLT